MQRVLSRCSSQFPHATLNKKLRWNNSSAKQQFRVTDRRNEIYHVLNIALDSSNVGSQQMKQFLKFKTLLQLKNKQTIQSQERVQKRSYHRASRGSLRSRDRLTWHFFLRPPLHPVWLQKMHKVDSFSGFPMIVSPYLAGCVFLPRRGSSRWGSTCCISQEILIISQISRAPLLHFSTLEKTKIDHNPLVNNLILTFPLPLLSSLATDFPWSLLHCPQTHTIKLLGARIRHMKEQNQCLSSHRFFLWDLWCLFSLFTNFPVRSKTREIFPTTETMRSHNSRAGNPSNLNQMSNKMISIMFLPKWILILQDLLQSQNLETVQSALLSNVSHLAILLVFTRMMNIWNQSIQAFVTNFCPFCYGTCELVYWP